MILLRRTAATVLAVLSVAAFSAAESLPPPPGQYVADEAGVLEPDAEAQINARLRQFDQETSNQVVVALFPKVPSASMEDFTIRTAQSWRAGRGKLSNGVILFVFVADRQIRMEVGYGLEGALPDITAKRIIEDRIKPAFRNNDYAGGVAAGVAGIMEATKGEYKAAPQPVGGRPQSERGEWMLLLFILIIVMFFFRGGGGGGRRTYGRRGYGGGFYGGGFGGGGFSGGGGGFGGGFSGGGGSFGGGGASGSW